jgi:hypothetical protein
MTWKCLKPTAAVVYPKFVSLAGEVITSYHTNINSTNIKKKQLLTKIFVRIFRMSEDSMTGGSHSKT